jgi:hypothetical protein
MMKTVIFITLILLLATTLVTSCKSKPAEPETEILPAPIHEVDIRIAESYPPQVFVYIKGGLSDGCTTFREIKTSRNGETINIEVTVQRPKNRICTQVYGFFEKNVGLGSDFISGKTYTIKVNTETKTFTMQ